MDALLKIPRPKIWWLSLLDAFLKIPRPLSCGRGQAARRLLCFCNRRDAREAAGPLCAVIYGPRLWTPPACKG